MITSEIELQQTREQLTKIEEGLVSLRQRVHTANPDRFRLMAESYVNEIEHLRGRIDEYTGAKTAKEAIADFVIRIQDPTLLEGIAPATLVCGAISSLQRGVRRMGEYISRSTTDLETEFLPSRVLARQFDLEVVALSPGSFEVGLRMAPPPEELVSAEVPTEAIRKFSQALRSVSHGEATGVQDIVPELNYQLQILEALRDLAPSTHRKEVGISFFGRFLGEATVLSQETRLSISRLIRVRTQTAREEGIVREIDLDKKTMKLRTAATLLRCEYDQALAEKVKHALDRKVAVSGRARIGPNHRIKNLLVEKVEIL